MNLQEEKSIPLVEVPDGVNDVVTILQLSKNMIFSSVDDALGKSPNHWDLKKICECEKCQQLTS